MYEKQRIDYFDIAKGIAILAVILGHCGGISQVLINLIFSFHMPIFFFTSGFFLKPQESKTYAVRKAKQLLFPYVITGLVIIIMSTFCLISRRIFIDEIYANILNRSWALFYGSGQEYLTPVYIPNAQALWFFPALFFSLLIVNECVKKKYSAVYIGIIAFIGHYTSMVFWIPLSVQAGMVSAIYVYLGYEAKKFHLFEILKQKIVAVEILIIYVLYYIWGGGRLYLVRNWLEQGIWEIVGSLCGVFCLIMLSQIISMKFKPAKQVFSFLGKNTQLILCFHIIDLSIFDWGFIYDKFYSYGNVILFSILFILRSLWAVCGMMIFKFVKNRLKSILSKRKREKEDREECMELVQKERNVYIDVARGTAILLMIYAHYPIEAKVSTIIFSFHMPIFIILSGYFYNKSQGMKVVLRKTGKSLIVPYFFASAAYAFISAWFYAFYTDISIVSGKEMLGIFLQKLSYAPWGISYASTRFQDIESVGPIWFIICLAFIRILYSILGKIFQKDKSLSIVIVLVSALGYLIGKYVAYLPWSADVGMVSLLFFHCGYLVRKYEMLEKPVKVWVLTALFIIWILDIRLGRLDLAARSYPYFPICIAGAIAGSILILELSKWLMKLEIVKQILSFCGRHSMIILCVHCLEQRTCSWAGILPEQSAGVVYIFRLMIILTFVVLCLIIRVLWQEEIFYRLKKYVKFLRKEYIQNEEKICR